MALYPDLQRQYRRGEEAVQMGDDGKHGAGVHEPSLPCGEDGEQSVGEGGSQKVTEKMVDVHQAEPPPLDDALRVTADECERQEDKDKENETATECQF